MYKEQFINIYKENITRPGAEELLRWLESSDFFTAPASTRYHLAYSGGLCEHSINVYFCLKRFLEERGITEYPEETIAIVSLLHDLCKVNFYKVGTRNVKVDGRWETKEVFEIEEKFPCGDHADKSVIILQNFMKLQPEEILAIRGHMGAFDNVNKAGGRLIGNIFEKSTLALYTHFADLEATYILEGGEKKIGSTTTTAPATEGTEAAVQ